MQNALPFVVVCDIKYHAENVLAGAINIQLDFCIIECEQICPCSLHGFSSEKDT